jgi:hypothetical protein
MKPMWSLLAACALAVLALGVSLSLRSNHGAVDSRPPTADERKQGGQRAVLAEQPPASAVTIREEAAVQAPSPGPGEARPVGALALDTEEAREGAETQWRQSVLVLSEPEQRALVAEMRAQIYSDQTRQQLMARVEAGPYELVGPNGFEYERWRHEIFMVSIPSGKNPEVRKARLERGEAPEAYHLLGRVTWLEDQIAAQPADSRKSDQR